MNACQFAVLMSIILILEIIAAVAFFVLRSQVHKHACPASRSQHFTERAEYKGGCEVIVKVTGRKGAEPHLEF